MQVVTVGYDSNGRYSAGFGAGRKTKGRACKICLRVLREGQRALRANDWIYCHLSCLGELVRDESEFTNPSVVQNEFDAIRDRLIASRGE